MSVPRVFLGCITLFLGTCFDSLTGGNRPVSQGYCEDWMKYTQVQRSRHLAV